MNIVEKNAAVQGADRDIGEMDERNQRIARSHLADGNDPFDPGPQHLERSFDCDALEHFPRVGETQRFGNEQTL